MEKIPFPPSVQSDLFNYLKPSQQTAIKPFLRIIKQKHQSSLCVALLDYLEGHGYQPLGNPVLDALQKEIIQACQLHPLTSLEPKSLGTILKQMFNK